MERFDWKQYLQDADVRAMRILAIALALGVLIFLLIVVLMALQRREGDSVQGSLSILRFLTLTHLILFAAALAGAAPLRAWVLRRQRSPDPSAERERDPEGYAIRSLAAQRSAMIARLSLLEGAVFFGLVVLIMAASNGWLAQRPVYWINALSAVIFVLMVLTDLPTREKLLAALSRENR